MAKWWTRRNGDMVKFQNVMVFFSYLQLILYQTLINKRSGSEEIFPHHFLLHFCPSRPLQIYVPLLIPLLHLHDFPHIRPLKLHPYLCLLLSPSYLPCSFPLSIHIYRDLHTPLHLRPHIRLHLPHDVRPPLNLHLHIRPLHLPLPLPIFRPLPLRYSYLHLTH